MVRNTGLSMLGMAIMIGALGCAIPGQGDDAEAMNGSLTRDPNTEIFIKKFCARVHSLVPGATCRLAPSFDRVELSLDINPSNNGGVTVPSAMEIDAKVLVAMAADWRRRGLDVPVRENLRPVPTPGGPISPVDHTALPKPALSAQNASPAVGKFAEFAIGMLAERGVSLSAGALVNSGSSASTVFTIDPGTSTRDIAANRALLQQQANNLGSIALALDVADVSVKVAIFAMTLACPATLLASTVLAVSWGLPTQVFASWVTDQKSGLQKEIDAHVAELSRRGALGGTGGGGGGAEPTGSGAPGGAIGHDPVPTSWTCVTRRACVSSSEGTRTCQLFTRCTPIG